MKHFRLQLIGVFLIVLAFVAGCSEPKTTLSGKVTYKDKPVPAGTVVFVSEDGTKQDSAEIQPDGTYTSSTVPLGNLNVAVVPAAKGVSKMMPKSAKTPKLAADDPLNKVFGQTGADHVPIPDVLQNPKTSKITVTVGPDTKTFDITLKDPK